MFFQLEAIPLVKPKSMNGFLVIIFNNIVQNIENFRAILVIFFKTYWTNFCIALGQTAGPIILIISLHKFSCLISKKDYLYITLFLFEIRRLNRRSPKIAHGWQKTKHGWKQLKLEINIKSEKILSFKQKQFKSNRQNLNTVI